MAIPITSYHHITIVSQMVLASASTCPTLVAEID